MGNFLTFSIRITSWLLHPFFSTQAKKAIKSYTASRFLCFGVVGELKTDDKASRA